MQRPWLMDAASGEVGMAAMVSCEKVREVAVARGNSVAANGGHGNLQL